MRDRTDEELMAAHAEGEAAAFEALVERYAGRLMRMFRANGLSESDAQDLVQQTFLQVHRARRDYRRGAPLRPWLYTIAHNTRRQLFRRRGRRPEAPLSAAGDRADSAAGPERVALRRDVRQALGALPAGQREVIVLHWFEGLPFAEVARSLGIKLSAAKVRAHRGYAALRGLLTEGADD